MTTPTDASLWPTAPEQIAAVCAAVGAARLHPTARAIWLSDLPPGSLAWAVHQHRPHTTDLQQDSGTAPLWN